jgi:hypothetical protein
MHYTQKEVEKIVRALGLAARVVDGEWRINFKRGAESTAYYTDDSMDAVATARLMSESREDCEAVADALR